MIFKKKGTRGALLVKNFCSDHFWDMLRPRILMKTHSLTCLLKKMRLLSSDWWKNKAYVGREDDIS